MRLVETLIVRDEEDIVGAQIAYHLNAGVDFVIATDHESVDGTTEILESYAREGLLLRIPKRGPVDEAVWRTEMARLAATDYAADWVVSTDADEFWVPRGGTLKEVLGAVPDVIGVLSGLSRHFVPRPDDGCIFAERMTVRVSPLAALNDPTSPYRPHAKAVHRAHPAAIVTHGAHGASVPGMGTLPRGWYVGDVLHFPFRTFEQWQRKGVRRGRGDHRLGQYVRALLATEAGEADRSYRLLVVDDEALERGCAAGTLVIDTRLRDVLRNLLGDGEAVRSPVGSHRFTLSSDPGSLAPSDDIDEGESTIRDAGALLDAETVRLFRQLDGLLPRLAALEARR